MIRYCIAFLLVLSSALAVSGLHFLVSWDPNVGDSTVGYVVQFGQGSGATETSVDVGDVTEMETPELGEGVWYSRVLAYNIYRDFGPPSNEIAWHIFPVIVEISDDLSVWRKHRKVLVAHRILYDPDSDEPKYSTTRAYFRIRFPEGDE